MPGVYTDEPKGLNGISSGCEYDYLNKEGIPEEGDARWNAAVVYSLLH